MLNTALGHILAQIHVHEAPAGVKGAHMGPQNQNILGWDIDEKLIKKDPASEL